MKLHLPTPQLYFPRFQIIVRMNRNFGFSPRPLGYSTFREFDGVKKENEIDKLFKSWQPTKVTKQIPIEAEQIAFELKTRKFKIF